MTGWPSHRDPVEWLAHQFALRIRRGEHPAICDYVARYPQYASEIEELFPVVAMIERWRQRGRTHPTASAK